MPYLKTLGLSLCLSLATHSGSVLASGSFSGGGFGPQDAYNHGKVIFHKKVVCKSCPLAGAKANRSTAEKTLMLFKEKDQMVAGLSGKEQKAVAHYLKKRFDLD